MAQPERSKMAENATPTDIARAQMLRNAVSRATSMQGIPELGASVPILGQPRPEGHHITAVKEPQEEHVDRPMTNFRDVLSNITGLKNRTQLTDQERAYLENYARRLWLESGARVELKLQEKPPEWWPFSEAEWKTLDIKDGIVEAAVKTMRHFYDMSNAERDANKAKFTASYKDFSEFAMGKKLYSGKDTRIIAAELELVEFDEKEIQKYKADSTKQTQITEALNKLDFLEHERAGIANKITDQNSGDERLRPVHISKNEWKKYLERPQKIAEELAEAEQVLKVLTGLEFFNRRREIKSEVETKVKALKAIIAKEEEEKDKGYQTKEEQLEQILEGYLLKDIEIPLEDSNPYSHKPVQEILQFITFEGGKPVAQQSAVDLEYAIKALEWNFHQARKLGIFEDLEERFDAKYQELAMSLFSKSGADQVDMEMEGRRVSRNLTLAEVKEIMAKESNEHNQTSLINTVEHDSSWQQLIRDGLLSRAGADHFKGIRKAFVSGAYDQMYDSLSNLYKRFRAEELKMKLDYQLAQGTITQQRYDRSLRPMNVQRLSGEWDARKQERTLQAKLEAEERAQADRLFYVDRYYLTLTGATTAQVEQGVNNYLTSLLEGAHVYDVQTIMQKMQYLSAAIMSKKDDLMKFEGLSASQAQERLTKINVRAENRGEFYVMNFAAQNLMMDEYFIPLYEKWGGVIGIEKMKDMLDMNNGLVAPAMLLFLDKKNSLLFQPAGFKGQGMKNIWTQRTLRNQIKEQLAAELVNYQARKANPTDLMEQSSWQDFLRQKFTDRVFQFQGKDLKPKDAVDAAKAFYEQVAKQIKENPGSTKVEIEQNLMRLRKAKEESSTLRNKYYRLLAEAKSAVETTWQVFNIFGESARLGAPSIIMDNGDHISIEDATYIYKFSILEKMKETGDTPAKMRWRAYQWTKSPWRYNKEGTPVVQDPSGNVYELVKGLEDTGMTKEEFAAFRAAAKELRTNGYKTALKKDADENPLSGYSFEEIISRNDVKPVRDNFISNYKSSREIFANLTAMREAKKGRQPFIMKILERLDQSGRGKFTTLDRATIDGKPLDEVPDERLKELFEDAITDSLVFHITVRQLARWEATFTPEVDRSSNMVCDSRSNIAGKFSTDRLYYGSQDIPWGVKRLQYLPEYWMTNKRERVGRAWKLLPFIPLFKSDLAQECDAENLPELILNLNKEHLDEPGLKQISASFKDAQGWRQRGETSIDEQRGETVWSYWDKPTVDSAQIQKIQVNLPVFNGKNLTLDDYIKADNPQEYMKQHTLSKRFAKELVDITREILKREAPLNVYLEAQLGYNRSAGGSGIGLEMGERMHYRKFQWWLSEEKGEKEHKRGTEGGLVVNSDAAQFFKFISIKNSWSEGMSILDEAWRQARGTKDPGASDLPPHLVIT